MTCSGRSVQRDAAWRTRCIRFCERILLRPSASRKGVVADMKSHLRQETFVRPLRGARAAPLTCVSISGELSTGEGIAGPRAIRRNVLALPLLDRTVRLVTLGPSPPG